MTSHLSKPQKLKFEEKRRNFKNVSDDRYHKHLQGLIGNFKTNPKRFWTFLKSIKGAKGQIPTLLDGIRQVSSDKEKADLLNKKFASKFTAPEVTHYPETTDYNLPNLTTFDITEARVRAILETLQVHKACGPDNISARVIKECRNQLAYPLTILFRKSIEEGVFPSRLAEANIVPVFKKGSRNSPENYRSVSLLPLFGKIMERCVFETLLAHVQPVLTDKQHGFVPRRSCETNLATLLKTAWDSISSGHQLDILYLDYSSAFQSVNHKLLLYKIKNSYSISGQALLWLQSYLCDRKQRVIINGKCSDWTKVRSGTPEGSLISPLLFALFINDLPDVIRAKILMFADDVKLFNEITCTKDVETLQKDLNQLIGWSEKWKLNLNPTKCQSFRITLNTKPILASYKIHNNVLEHVQEIRDLGVWLDTKLTFQAHINRTVSKANRMLGLLMRSLQNCRTAARLMPAPILAAYFGNVRSILEYGSVIWGGAAKTHLERLERIQHKFLMWLAAHTHLPQQHLSFSYNDLLDHFKIASLSKRRLKADILFIYKILISRIDSTFLLGNFPLHVPQRRTREGRNQLLHISFGRVETVKNGLFTRAARAFNDHISFCPSADPFNSTFSSFRSTIVKYVRDHPF